jgi:hypothetical protein
MMRRMSALDVPTPRFWWLKRLVALFAVFIILLVAFDVWWAHEARRRIEVKIAEIHARGEPILPEDFDAPPVPAAQNAALSLTYAANPLASGNSADTFLDAHGDDVSDAWKGDVAKNIAASNVASLQLARRARSQSGADWKSNLRSPVITAARFPNLNSQRELARLLRFSAHHHHAIGDDREAVETIRDMVNQSHVLARQPPVLVVHLVCLGLQGMTCATIEQIAPDLRVEPEGTTNPQSATRQQGLDLIAELSDDARFAGEAQQAWKGERMQVLDAGRNLLPFGLNSPSNPQYWLKPAFELDGLRAGNDMDMYAAASARPNLPAARAMLRRKGTTANSSHLELVSTMTSNMLGGVGRAVEQDFRALVERRGNVLRLAIRLYQIDHNNAYPTTLNELFPKYLPKVPVDPYAADGRAMSYRAGAPFPAVWSVGSNGVDDGGTSLPNPSNPSTANRWECADIVYPLERSVPATQPVSGN